MRPMIISHANCPDGGLSAWLVWMAYRKNADVVRASYGQFPPVVMDRDVIIADFSYGPEELGIMAKEATSILVLDHHQTAVEALAGFEADNVTLWLDQKRSGAGLTWEHYKGELAAILDDRNLLLRVSNLVAWVEDRDLWKFTYPETPAAFATITSFPDTLESWDLLAAMSSEEIIEAGEHIGRYRRRLIESAVANHRFESIGGTVVPVANAPYSIGSDVAEELNRMFPDYPFAAYYLDGADERAIGLRSAGNGADVAKIAESFGGGGHRHAAAFRVPIGWRVP